MMTRLISITIVALAACLMFAGIASAKGPFFKAELSGGDLASPIMLGDLMSPDALNNQMISQPESLPGQSYTLRLFSADEHGKISGGMRDMTYYPAHEGNPPVVRYGDGEYKSVSKELATVVEANLPELRVLNVQPEPEDGGTTVAWWLIPAAVGLGLFVVGGGIAGGRMLKKRQAAAA